MRKRYRENVANGPIHAPFPQDYLSELGCDPVLVVLSSANRAMAAPLIQALDEAHCVATWDRVLIQIWRGPVTLAATDDLFRVGREFTAQRKHLVNSLAIVESRSPPPDDKLRGRLSAWYREFAPRMAHQIILAEGSGFRLALARGVGLALTAYAPRLLPFTYVATLEEAYAAIAPMLSPGERAAGGLEQAVDNVRQQLDDWSAPHGTASP